MHKKFDETSRVNTEIKKTGRDYLPESFDLYAATFPSWKTPKKELWKTRNGFDLYSGHDHPHVGYEHPGSGKEINHQGSITGRMAWS